ncbi:YdeI/OmpD-associated family protein [Nocardioides montaniterrae]
MHDDEPGTLGGTTDRPARFFRDAGEFAAWLERHHDTATELWMGLNKKHVADRGLTWEQAVPEALCWGWIDSKIERIDDDAIRQRWTPRKRTSNWSKVNLALFDKLRAEGRIRPPGLAIWEQRRESTVHAYEQKDKPQLPPAYAERLAANAKATAFWQIATPSYRALCASWVVTAKQEATRERRIQQLIDDCANGRMIPSQRYGTPPRWVERAAAAAAEA